MLKNIVGILFLIASPIVLAESPYTAIISCGMQNNINVLACFTDTDLKITENNSSTIYKVYEIEGIGDMYQNGLHIKLPENFELLAQNNHDTLVLEIKILDKNDNVIFKDQASKWGVINVAN